MTKYSEMNVGPYADVLMDRWFKRTFGWYPAKRLLTLFLKELIPEREIIDLSYGPQEHVNPIDEGKDVRVDVECTDKDGTRFVVEMQIAEQGGFYNRAVFNSAFAIQQQIPRGVRAFDYPPVYFIGVMDFSVHEGSDRVLYRYTLQETNTHELMTDSVQYLFLELPNCKRACTSEASVLDNFCYALHNIGHMKERPAGLEGEIFDLLFKSAEISKFAMYERTQYFEDMTTQEDIKRMIAFAEDKGVAKGMAEGKAEQARKIAQTLLSRGMSVPDVSEITGLASCEVERLLRS
jgi:predicted transposase/invertase (TIGR01784 family)